MKNIFKFIIFFLLTFSASFSEEISSLSFESSAAVISYQQAKNREIQHLLDRVYGVERVMIDVKINVVRREELDASFANLLLPGVPATQVSTPRISNIYYLSSYDVNLWTAPDITNQNAVEEMIKDVLEFEKYPLSTIIINRALDKKGKTQSFLTEETLQGIKEIMNTINISIRVPEIGIAMQSSASSNQTLTSSIRTQMTITNLIILLIGFLVIILVVSLFIILISKSKKEAISSVSSKGDRKGAEKSGEKSEVASGSGGPTTVSAGGGFSAMPSSIASAAGSGFSVDGSHKSDGFDVEDEITKKREFFTFIDESNIFKLAFLLKQEKPKGKSAEMAEYWQNIAIIVSFLPSHLSRIIFMKYSVGEQSEIIPYLAYEIDYPIEQIEELEKALNDKLENLVLVGGKRSVMPILDNFSNQKKSELAKQLNERHPDVLTEIRDMIILFEDITGLPKESLTKLLMEVDPNILALTFITMPEEQRADIFSGLAEGLRDIINEVIELRKENYTEVEVQDATDTFIQQAKLLNRKGVIKLNLTGFGDQEDSIEQDEIDKLFDDDKQEEKKE